MLIGNLHAAQVSTQWVFKKEFQMSLCFAICEMNILSFSNRSVKLHYKENVTNDGIKGYRFWGSNTTFANGSVVPGNECYCVKDTCAPTGKGLMAFAVSNENIIKYVNFLVSNLDIVCVLCSIYHLVKMNIMTNVGKVENECLLSARNLTGFLGWRRTTAETKSTFNIARPIDDDSMPWRWHCQVMFMTIIKFLIEC